MANKKLKQGEDEFPRPRSGAVVFVYQNQLMTWGGMTQVFYGEGENRFLVSKSLPEVSSPILEVLDLDTYEWRKELTHGAIIPRMGSSSYHVLYHDTLYLFGGTAKDYHKDLFKLDLCDFHWELVSLSRASSEPSPTSEGGSARFGTSMYIYGGKGNPLPHSNSPHGATFKANLNFGYLCDDGWHNALYEFNIVEDTWSEIGKKNDGRPPPCSRFSFTKIDSQRILLFGGKQDKYRVTYGDVYILNINTQEWEKHSPRPNQRWPSPRGFHVANCLVDPESDEAANDQRVIVFWGQGADARHVPDIWIFHVQSITWKEFVVSPLYELRPRMFFSSCCNHIQARQTDVIVYGGNKQRKDKFDRNVMTNPLIIRFGSVKRLSDLCLSAVKDYSMSENELKWLPNKVRTIVREHNGYTPPFSYHPVVIYPLETNFKI